MPAHLATSHRLRRCWPLLVYVAAVVVMLGPSLTGTRVALPHDILQAQLPWSATEHGVEAPYNGELRDQIDQYYPLQEHLIGRLRAGEDATFVPDLMLGTPGAHFVGWGVLSPFTLPSLVLPFPFAWSLGQGLRLLTAMGGAHVLARSFGIGRLGATVAGLSFGLCGYMTLWLGWPQTHVGALVPWVLWATRRTNGSETRWWGLPALVVTVAGLWLGGFPAVSTYALMAAGIVGLHGAWGARAEPRAATLGLVAVAGGILLGTALVAATLLPSVAWLTEIDLEARSRAWRAQVFPRSLWTFLVPGLFGDVVTHRHWMRAARVETVGYAGIVPLLLAVPAWLLRPRRQGVLLWSGVTLGFGLLAYGFPPLQALIRNLPVLNANPPNRVLVLVGLGIAMLGGYGADALARAHGRKASPTRRGLAVLGSLVVLMVATLVVTRPWQAVRALARQQLPDPAAREAAAQFAVQQTLVAGALVLAAVIVLLLAWVLRRQRAGAAILSSGLVAVVAADLLLFATGWNPQVPRSSLFPPAPGYEEATARSDGHRSSGADGVGLGNTSLVYGFPDIRGRTFRTPRQRDALRDTGALRYYSPTLFDLDSRRSAAWDPWLSLLGVRSVLTPSGVREVPLAVPVDADSAPLAPLVDGAVQQGTAVVPTAGGTLQGVQVIVHARGDAPPSGGAALTAVVELPDGTRVEGSTSLAEIDAGFPAIIPVEPVAVLAGELEVTFTSRVPDEVDAPVLLGEPGERVAVGAVLAERQTWEATDLGPVRLFDNPNALPRVHLATDLRPAAPEATLDAVAALRPVDLASTAVIEAYDGHLPALPAGGGTGAVTRFTIDGATIRATVDSEAGGVVVVGMTPWRGWSATVDGATVPLVVANHLLLGVPVHAGSHDLQLHYRPPGLMAGAMVSALAFAVLLGVGWRALRTDRQPNPPDP